MSQSRADEFLSLASALIAEARRQGADAADVVVMASQSLGISWRLGKLEDVERSESCDLGLRIFAGRRQAFVSSTDLAPEGFKILAERALAMAKLAPEDPYCGLADPARLAKSFPALDLEDPAEPSAERLTALAAETEDAARAIKGVTNSNGASAGWSSGTKVLVTSAGFAAASSGTSHSLGCSVVAGEGTTMETDYEGSSARHAADLDAPAAVGTKAGERAVKRLNPRKLKSMTLPVLYDPRIAGGLLGHLSGAINGAAIARGVSFLKDRMGERVFAPGIRVMDDPLRRRGQRSRPFDGEGVAGERRAMIEDGILMSWFLDTGAGKQLGLPSTGHAARGTGGPPSPSPTNLYLEPGPRSPEAMIKSLKQGLYVTDLIGMGVSGVTGDYSRGAAGFFIEDGTLAYPVSEITVAGNLKEMFRELEPASDLVFRYGINAPTILIASLTVAGT
jgi:PmbA protein